MTGSRDRRTSSEGKRRVKPTQSPQIRDREFARRVAEFCRLAHQQNTELLGLLRQQRQALLGLSGRKGWIQ